MVKIKCDYCGQEIEKYPYDIENHKHHFCNNECQNKFMTKPRVKLTCLECGKELSYYPSSPRKFCSKECFEKYTKREAEKKIITRKCKECGKEFEVPIRFTKEGNGIFCSRKCSKAYRSRQNNEYSNCKYCGKKIRHVKSRSPSYCSLECRNKHYKIIRRGKNSPLYNPKISKKDRISRRLDIRHKEWSYAVKERDGFTCQICGKKSDGDLESHHINSYRSFKNLRYDIDNGITMCEKCHRKFHKTYGYKDFTAEDFIKFQNKEKISRNLTL